MIKSGKKQHYIPAFLKTINIKKKQLIIDTFFLKKKMKVLKMLNLNRKQKQLRNVYFVFKKKKNSKGKNGVQRTETKGFDNRGSNYSISLADRHVPSAGETV